MMDAAMHVAGDFMRGQSGGVFAESHELLS